MNGPRPPVRGAHYRGAHFRARRRGRLRAVPAVLATVLTLVTAAPLYLAAPIAATTAATAATSLATATHQKAAHQATVRFSVTSISPSAPIPSESHLPLTVQLHLSNLTASTLSKLTITLQRGEPVVTQSALDTALAHPDAPVEGYPIPTAERFRVTLAPHASANIEFRTSTGIPDLPTGICLCAQAVYPLEFAVTTVDGMRLATTTTFMPSFHVRPRAVKVAWLWPLIDRPHRAGNDSLFFDDDLRSLVATNGRLSRALEVIEQVSAKKVPVTLLVDPELLDELAVMASAEGYRVQTDPRTTPVTGTGGAVAASWLGRLQALLADHPDVALRFTAYADPDVQSLSAHGVGWRVALPAAMRARIIPYLSGRAITSGLNWPAAGPIGRAALNGIAKLGARTLVLPATSLRHASGTTGVDRIATSTGPVAVAALQAAPQRYVPTALTDTGGDGLQTLPRLMAEIAIKTIDQPSVPHALVLAPTRYIDASVRTAVRTILDTSRSTFSTPAAVTDVASPESLPKTVATLAPLPDNRTELPSGVLATAASAPAAIGDIASMLGARGGGDAPTTSAQRSVQAMLTRYGLGLQRTKSSAFRGRQQLGTQLAAQLRANFGRITGAVNIVRPSTRTGSYTLGSNDSPLPITVQNKLGVPVSVRVRVRTLHNIPGLSVRDIGAQTVDAGSRRTLHLPATIVRAGRIDVDAQLLTPNGGAIGSPTRLTVRSTALGLVGVIITIVAGGVLVIALIVRGARQLIRRRRRRRQPPAGPPNAVRPTASVAP